MPEPDPSILRAAIFEIIESQMRDGTPPETKETFERLIAAGNSHEDAMKLIGRVVSSQIFDMLKEPLFPSRPSARITCDTGKTFRRVPTRDADVCAMERQ